MDKTPRTDVVVKLRYMARQYTNGQIARGGNPQKHYLDEAADEIETLRKRSDEAERDAKRYRLLRLQNSAGMPRIVDPFDNNVGYTPEGLDAALHFYLVTKNLME